MDEQIDALAARAGQLLLKAGWSLTTAESCTGGGIGYAVTSVPGSSAWYQEGYITYSNAAKTKLLGVEPRLLEVHGAVSEPVVKAMAEGALRVAEADIAVAVSGVAGPGGGSPEKPVGTVWIGWAVKNMPAQAQCFVFDGDRKNVRIQTVVSALQGVVSTLNG